MKRPIFRATLTLLATAAAAQANTIELIQNGGFESNLSGWNASANVIQTGNYFGILPSTGSGMAAMSVVGFLDSNLSQSVDLTGITSATLSFSLNLTALDTTRFLELGIDSLSVSIGGIPVFTEPLNDPWNGTSILNPGTPTTTGWVLHSGISVPVNLLGQGNISFAFNVENVPPGGGDPGQNFVALIDDVSVKATVPDRGVTLAFLAFGALTVARCRRSLS